MKTIPQLRAAIATLALLFTAGAGHGQGTGFTYQGRLHDSGAPAGGIYDLRFTIYDALAGGGIAAGPATNASVAVSNGLFTVTLDFGAGVFNGAARWLEIGVRPGGSAAAFTALEPRQPITSTPHAIRALNAGTVTGSVSAAQITGTITPANIAAGTITSAMIANGAVNTAQLADGAVTAGKVFTETNWAAPAFLTTVGNQIEDNFNYFGYSVAAVGADKFVVGAPFDDTFTNSGGAAYVFDATGRRLSVLKRPSPGIGDEFGWSVTGVGPDKVLVSAPEATVGSFFSAGVAELFTVSGEWLATFVSPTPASSSEFASAIAAVGDNRIVIGEEDADSNKGRVYVFDLAGNVLTTITNPFPAVNFQFGRTVASVGTDKFLVAAPNESAGVTNGGVVYLFDLTGNRLATFASPVAVRGEFFGHSLAGVGSDKVVIGSFQNPPGGQAIGAAYLFDLSGNLLTTFVNPAPAAVDLFGGQVAAVGPDKVLISARGDDLGSPDAGTAYLFDLSGNLIATIGNPSPAPGDQFGQGVAGLGDHRLIVTTPNDRTGPDSYGAAHIFTFAAHAPGLFADGVRGGGVNTISLADGAVTTAKIADYSILASKLPSAVINNEHLANNAVTTDRITNSAVTAAKVFQTTDWSQPLAPIAITNPSPVQSSLFSFSASRLGNSRLLIGVPQRNSAYIYGTNGFLQRTIANPPPSSSGDQFGFAVAGLDDNRLLAGAPGEGAGGANSGVVHLFQRNNGSLILTITNPAPNVGDNFGSSVVAVGTNVIAIGALGDDGGSLDAGAVHLFGTNGAFLRTIANPAPTTGDQFSFALATVGTDRLLVGAPGEDAGGTDRGRAYLFHTNGALITTLTNPATGTSNLFGQSVAAIAPDKLLVGAPNNDLAGNNAGAAYLFGTNGALLVTFTKPLAAAGDNFGTSVSAMGTNHIVIGAPGDDAGATNAGAAYVFDLAGNWVATLLNPSPGPADMFGAVVAGAGADTALVGAPTDDAPANNEGTAYLFPFAGYAPGIFADGVRSDSIGTLNLVDGAVTSSKIADGAVGTDQLADGSVTAAKLGVDVGVWNRSGTNISYAAGRVGIGTASPTSTLEVNGTVAADAFTGSGAGLTSLDASDLSSGTVPDARLGANIARLNAVQTFGSTNVFAGRVGIGILNPGHPLSVSGVSHQIAVVDADNANKTWTLTSIQNNGGIGLFEDGSTGRFVVEAGGAVGIGEANPTAQLHVRTTSSLSNPQLHLVDNGANGFARARLSAGTKPYWDIAAGGANNVINFFTSGGNGDVMTLTTNGNLAIDGTLTQGSDRRRKTDLAPVEPLAVLEKVAALPLATWRYKSDPTETKHLGPMAQDFHAAFGLNGADDKHIATVDADGVTLAAIQGLNRKLEGRLKQMENENQSLKRRLEKLERLLDSQR